ncbi:LppU/SCO3897 family protein [Streptomyces sp. enrichment culture]|uniref:LppU/SCO3897 family protein n=1 Tax=Streptomyces sp. enrichment culture TaxID=1795815 RepID=UPI003F55BAC4
MSQTAQQSGAGARGRLAVVAVAGAVLLTVGCTGQTNDDSTNSSSDSYATSSPYDPYTEDPSTEDPYAEDTYSDDSDDSYSDGSDDSGSGDSYEDPYAEPSETEEPDPYTSGTCLNGELPNSTTAQSVSNVDEVDCNASDAHYKVIESIPMTSDMSRCNDNPQTQYAFSSRYTLNGVTISEYVYCLVGLGAYAR